MRDGPHIALLVEVVPADERQDPPVGQRDREHSAGVTLGGRGCEPREVSDADIGRRRGQPLEGCAPPGAEHHGYVMRPERRGGVFGDAQYVPPSLV